MRTNAQCVEDDPPALAGRAAKSRVSFTMLSLVKLCVGCDSVEDLEHWIAVRLREREQKGAAREHVHTTRMVPRRASALLDGGSLYWVIKNSIQCRQSLVDIRPFVDSQGVSRCSLVLEPRLVRTHRQPRRPFQGWRYLDAADAPSDLESGRPGWTAVPPELHQQLAELGLL